MLELWQVYQHLRYEATGKKRWEAEMQHAQKDVARKGLSNRRYQDIIRAHLSELTSPTPSPHTPMPLHSSRWRLSEHVTRSVRTISSSPWLTGTEGRAGNEFGHVGGKTAIDRTQRA